MRIACRAVVLTLAVASALLIATGPAHATFPGLNGKIAFESDRDGNVEIYTMGPGGGGQTRITNSASYSDETPAWSPDGQQIVIACFEATEFCLRDADGSGSGQFFGHWGRITHPSWAPDGTRIAFDEQILWCDPPNDPTECDLSSEIAAVDVDGTDHQFLTSNDGAPDCCPAWSSQGDIVDSTSLRQDPNWSPDGTRIAYWRDVGASNDEIFISDADGTGEIRLTNDAVDDRHPAWSPDGHKIAFASNEGGDYEIFVMNADGSGRQALTANTARDAEPDWQALPYPNYPRPKGATPFEVSLVPAFTACTAPNRMHGPPLAFGSCNPPARSSTGLTVGTPDANGEPARFAGRVKVRAVLGNPATPADEADAEISASLTDVRVAAGLSDYTGDLDVRLPVRLTDRLGGDPATVEDFVLSATVPCAATADPALGAECGATTTADALAPGAVPEGARSVWALGRVSVHDEAGATFAVQGLFVP